MRYGVIFRCIEIEIKKIIFRKKYQLILGMIILLPIVYLIIYNIPGSGIFFTMGNLPYTVLSVSAYLLIPMLGFMIASDFFAGEEERGELFFSNKSSNEMPPLPREQLILIYSGLYMLDTVFQLGGVFLTSSNIFFLCKVICI